MDVLILEPLLSARTNFRELARTFCSSVSVSSSLEEGLARLRGEKNCDAIYVSSRFDIDHATHFVASSRETVQGQDSAHLLITGRSNRLKEEIATLTLRGFDGLLLDPPSVDTFQKSGELALKARREKRTIRRHKSIDLLVQGLMSSLDETHERLKSESPANVAMRRFRGLAQELKHLSPEDLEIYLERALIQFPEANPAAVMPPKPTLSSRIIRKEIKSL